MMNIFFYETTIGKIAIGEKDNFITNIFFNTDLIPKDVKIVESEIIKECYKQLDLYFSGKLKAFSVNIKPEGTEFMQKVWKELCNIPYGKTVSYKYIAEQIGNVKAVRAVGAANGKNPIPIIIPCHRVIGNNNKLVGYRGGLEIKEKLLKAENVIIK